MMEGIEIRSPGVSLYTNATSVSQSLPVREESMREEKGDEREIVLESFFYILTGHIDNFKNLVNVHLKVFIVIGQPVTSLDGIEQLKNLAELWVCECYLHDASQVNKCVELRKLHLYSNRLKDPPKTTNLKKLATLSLASNQLTTLSADFSEALRELNLADNSIADVSHLMGCKDLEILNLAGNNIRTMQALEPLTTLPKLRYLYFIDQMYKYSPVSSLVNYRSFLIYKMEHLKCLDSVPVESEERENCRNFYERNFRYYRVVFNNNVSAFYFEHRKLMSQSYKELNNLRTLIFSATITQNKASESSSIGRECRKKLQKYEVSQFQWECKHRDWYPRLEKELTVKTVLLEMEMSHYGNVNFIDHTKDGNVFSKILGMMQNFICPYSKRNMNLSSIEVDQVVQIISTQHHAFDKFNGVKEILGIGVMESQFFIISHPFEISDATRWPFNSTKNYISLPEANAMKCIVTNSVAIADCDWLDKNATNKNVGVVKDRLSGKRVLVLGYVLSDELMGSFTREETAASHVKSNDEPAQHCYHCAIYSTVLPENVIPSFIVEYRYIYKDNHFMTFADDFTIPEVDPVSFKPLNLSNKVNTCSWQSITTLNLAKMLISSFGPLSVFENVEELDVSYNQLTSLQEISRIFPKLTFLNAMFNDISSTNMAREMKNLTSLTLKYNKLSKFVLSLQWLKKCCKSLDKLDLANNPLTDIHDSAHKKFILVKYFPEIRKFDDEWLDDVQNNSVYRFCMKDFPSVLMSNEEYEEIKQSPKVYCNGATCLRDNCLPASHCALNEYRELICLFLKKTKQFQSLEIETKRTSLKWITITDNLLSSIEFVADFPQLEELDFSNNLLQHVSPELSTLKNLTKLNLSANYLRDVDAFLKIDLPSLRSLNLSYNCIRKIEGLKNLKTLDELNVCGNEIRRWDCMQFIKEWKNLKIIDLSMNIIEDEEMLRKFLIYHGTQLEFINGKAVTEEEITDANDTLSGTLNKNYLVKIYKPNQIKLLTELTVKKCGIRKANFRDPDFLNLTSVNLESNALTTLGSMSYLRQLKHLCLTNNKITSFGEIKRTFDHLESLHLNFNNITDLIPLELERFPKLSALFLQDNQLTSIEGVKELRRLQYLVVDRNKIAALKQDEMQTLELLKELYAENNQLKDLNFLKILRNARKLFLANNRIQDHVSIENLGHLKKLTELTIAGNPICRLNNHYLLILSQLPKLTLLDGHSVELQGDS